MGPRRSPGAIRPSSRLVRLSAAAALVDLLRFVEHGLRETSRGRAFDCVGEAPAAEGASDVMPEPAIARAMMDGLQGKSPRRVVGLDRPLVEILEVDAPRADVASGRIVGPEP